MIQNRAPVTIVAGFLGVGKTTLINQILQGDHGLNITIIVNDFGAINIDVDLILRREREFMELSNGCVCCSIQGDLVGRLLRLFKSDKPPAYLLVEASGVSHPGRIASVFGYPQLRDYARLDAVITLVDAANVDLLSADAGILVQSQIEAADIVLLTKADLVEKSALIKIKDQWLLPDLPVIEAVSGRVPVNLLLDIGGHRKIDIRPPAVDHAQMFRTISWSSDLPVYYNEFKTVLQRLPSDLYRAKGILYCTDFPDQQIVFQKVGARISFDRAGPWQTYPATRLVAIGERSKLNDFDLSEHLERCLTSGTITI